MTLTVKPFTELKPKARAGAVGSKLVAAICLAAAVGCHRAPQVTGPESGLVGTWRAHATIPAGQENSPGSVAREENADSTPLTINADHTFKLGNNEGNWSVADGKLTLEQTFINGTSIAEMEREHPSQPGAGPKPMVLDVSPDHTKLSFKSRSGAGYTLEFSRQD